MRVGSWLKRFACSYGADALDLGPGQDEPGLNRLLDAVLVACAAVERDRVLTHQFVPSSV